MDSLIGLNNQMDEYCASPAGAVFVIPADILTAAPAITWCHLSHVIQGGIVWFYHPYALVCVLWQLFDSFVTARTDDNLVLDVVQYALGYQLMAALWQTFALALDPRLQQPAGAAANLRRGGDGGLGGGEKQD